MDNVKLERDGVVATVTLNRPDRRNSLSDEMLTDLEARSPRCATMPPPASSSSPAPRRCSPRVPTRPSASR
jgi:hypothetical protein